MIKHVICGLIFLLLALGQGTGQGSAFAAEHEHDVVIYGGTSAAVIAAVQCHRMGKSVVVVAPDKHLGGLSAGGLGFTDIGNRLTIGGLSREFYQRVYQHYSSPEAWTQETAEEFQQKKIGGRRMWEGEKPRWVFEPHVAEKIFEQFLAENKIPVFKDQWLDRKNGVKKEAGRIMSFATLSGDVFKGKVFIDATYEGDLMAAAGVSYHVGREANEVYLYFLSHDPRVPKALQTEMQKWGLPKDEFKDNDHWSHQLYIREARRMIGHYVISEHDLLGKLKSKTEQSIGMGSYGIDSHNVQRTIDADGFVQNEGDVGVHVGPYRIPFGVIVPKKEEANNLIVPVAASCTHVAYGSIRMEPIFMILSQSAATTACIAIDDATSVQDVDYERLRKRLLADKQILEKSQVLKDPRKKK